MGLSYNLENASQISGKPVPSVFGGMTIIIHQTLCTYDIDVDEVFEKAGIDYSNINQPDVRITGRQYANLMIEGMKASGDPNLVIKSAQFIQPSCFNALGFALFSSRTIRNFLERLENYYSFLTTTEGCEFIDDPAVPRLNFATLKNVPENSINTAFLIGSLIWINRMIQLMHGPQFRQTRVTITHALENDSFKGEFETYFKCPIEYGSDYDSLIFNPEDLDQPLPTANAALAQQNDEIILSILARMEKADVPTRVRSKLLEMLPTGEYSKAVLAKELGYSVRAFHNKLAAADTSYQDILDETRLTLATQYLRQKHYSVGDVAFLLGFSDFSNFSRAFKKWTDKTPTTYRLQFFGDDEIAQ